ncbi:MAG: TnsA endonuclease N-terminal domain-containing protein [Bacteroidota bacterium]
MKKVFNYSQSHKIIYWGCSFDSLLELKYAISVQQDYEFLRSYIPIYYDPATRRPTSFIRKNIRRYTPDFLIRHKETKKAFWIEIKPAAYSDHAQLSLRKEVAERYILWKGYDWQYKVVYDDEIVLTSDQLIQFNEYSSIASKSTRKLLHEKYIEHSDNNVSFFISNVQGNSHIAFVMFGAV